MPRRNMTQTGARRSATYWYHWYKQYREWYEELMKKHVRLKKEFNRHKKAHHIATVKLSRVK